MGALFPFPQMGKPRQVGKQAAKVVLQWDLNIALPPSHDSETAGPYCPSPWPIMQFLLTQGTELGRKRETMAVGQNTGPFADLCSFPYKYSFKPEGEQSPQTQESVPEVLHPEMSSPIIM